MSEVRPMTILEEAGGGHQSDTTLGDHVLLPGEQLIEANGLQLAYQTFGDRSGVPLLLVMGLGTQMIGWPEGLCEDLAGRGHFVIRYDNRDIGRSTKFDDQPAPTIAELRSYALRRTPPPYTVGDMADDACGLLDALGIESAHLVGASMGGFVSQTAAIKAPHRFRSLTLIMTSTGSRRVGQLKPGLAWNMARVTPPRTADETVEQALATYRLIGSPGYAFDEDYLRAKSRLSYSRDPASANGRARQLAAIVAQPNRTAELSRLRVPTLVMHGLSDPLVRPSGGLALARTIPGATFVGYHGMGHDLPRPLWPDIAAQIGHLAHRADTVSAD